MAGATIVQLPLPPVEYLRCHGAATIIMQEEIDKSMEKSAQKSAQTYQLTLPPIEYLCCHGAVTIIMHEEMDKQAVQQEDQTCIVTIYYSEHIWKVFCNLFGGWEV